MVYNDLFPKIVAIVGTKKNVDCFQHLEHCFELLGIIPQAF